MESSNLLLRILLIVVLCCTAVGVASADTVIPGLTGGFFIPRQFVDFSSSTAFIAFPECPGGFAAGFLAFPNVDVVGSCDTQLPPCSAESSGDLAGYPLGIGVDNSLGNHFMSGIVTGGAYSVFVQILEENVRYGLHENFSFDAQWNNGWISQGEGEVDWDFESRLEIDNGGVLLSMVTSAPVPELPTGLMALTACLATLVYSFLRNLASTR